MKFQNIFILVLLAALVVGGVYYDAKISKLQNQLSIAIGKVDTVKVTLQIRDTVFVQNANTVEIVSDTIVKGDTIIIKENKNLVGITEQPLFTLHVDVNSKQEIFKYTFAYNPLSINLEFYDQYDLRKGFRAYTIPNIGDVSVNWGDYKPLRKKFGLSLSGGVFLLDNNPGLILGLSFKKNELGMMWAEGRHGYYYRRVLLEF